MDNKYTQVSLSTAAFFNYNIDGIDIDNVLKYWDDDASQWRVAGSVDIQQEDVDSILNDIDNMVLNNS